MDFSKSQMPEKSFQVTSRRRVTWRDFSGMSDLEKSILALPTHRIDIPAKKNTNGGKKSSSKPFKTQNQWHYWFQYLLCI